MNFQPLSKAGAVEGFCLIKTVERKMTAKGIPFLDMSLTDSDGEIVGKLWDYKEELHGEFKPNDLIKIRGTITTFNDSPQLRVERIRHVNENDEVNIDDFVPSAGFKGESMYNEIMDVVNSFEDEELKLLVSTILKDYKQKLIYWPAAFRLHHAVRGGLLYHTLSILRMAQAAAKIYPFVDSSLLFSGVILHDIAKTKEFEVADTGIASGYTVQGNLVGHLVMGAMVVEEYAKKLNINRDTAMLLEHMIISHHGEPEFGAAVRPMFLEAEILSELDTLDAKIYEIEQACRGVEQGEFTQRQWALDNRKLYNHGRNDEDFIANLL